MPILFSCVYQLPVEQNVPEPILKGNHPKGQDELHSICQSILKNLPSYRDTHKMLTQSLYTFHYVVKDGYIFMAVTDKDMPLRITQSFLVGVHAQFCREKMPSKANVILQNKMAFANDAKNDKIHKTSLKVNELKENISESIELVLKRGENIDNLLDHTEDLDRRGLRFRKTAKKINSNMKLRLVMIFAAIITLLCLVLCLLAVFGFLILCVFPLTEQKCFSSKSSGSGSGGSGSGEDAANSFLQIFFN